MSAGFSVVGSGLPMRMTTGSAWGPASPGVLASAPSVMRDVGEQFAGVAEIAPEPAVPGAWRSVDAYTGSLRSADAAQDSMGFQPGFTRAVVAAAGLALFVGAGCAYNVFSMELKRGGKSVKIGVWSDDTLRASVNTACTSGPLPTRSQLARHVASQPTLQCSITGYNIKPCAGGRRLSADISCKVPGSAREQLLAQLRQFRKLSTMPGANINLDLFSGLDLGAAAQLPTQPARRVKPPLPRPRLVPPRPKTSAEPRRESPRPASRSNSDEGPEDGSVWDF